MKSCKLYHVSEKQLVGVISCSYGPGGDFGKGFYMSKNKRFLHKQFCHTGGYCYTLKLDLSNLKCKYIEPSIHWVMLIAYHRGYLKDVQSCPYVSVLQNELYNADVLFSFIKNKKLLDAFFNDKLTDNELNYCLDQMHFEKQIVALTNEGCKAISIIRIEPLKCISNKIRINSGVSNTSLIIDEAVSRGLGGLTFSEIIDKIKEEKFDENKYTIKSVRG